MPTVGIWAALLLPISISIAIRLLPLRSLFSSTHDAHFHFPGTQLSSTKANAILLLFIVRALISRISRLFSPTPPVPPDVRQSITTPFELTSNDLSTFLRLSSATSTKANSLQELGSDPRKVQLFLASLASPSIILLLAKRGVDVDALGSVNVRNTFHSPSPQLARALPKALDRPNGLRMRASVNMRERKRVKRGWEFDVLAELLDGEERLWRMTFTTLALAKHKRDDGASLPQQPPPKANSKEDGEDPSGQVNVSLEDVDSWIHLSKDINPIHTSTLAARLFGLKGRIGHGNLVVTKALAALSQVEKEHAGDVEAEFLRPVHVPAVLDIVKMSVDGHPRVELRSKGKALVAITFK